MGGLLGGLGHIFGGVFGGIGGLLSGGIAGLAKGLVKTLLQQLNALIASAYVALLEFVTAIVARPLTPTTGAWEAGLEGNIRNLFLYLVSVVFLGMVIVGTTNQNRRADLGRSFLTLVIAGGLAKAWFGICDQLLGLGNRAVTGELQMFHNLGINQSLGKSTSIPDPFSAFFGLISAGGLSFILSLMTFSLPMMFLFGKYLGLLFFCLRVLTQRMQSAWDWLFGLLLVGAIFGRAVILAVLQFGVLAIKFGPWGHTTYGSIFYANVTLGFAIYALYKLIRNAPRIASRLTGGVVRSVSQITGLVTAEIRKAVRLDPGSGLKAYAVGQNVPSRTNSEIRQAERTQLKHLKRERQIRTGTTVAVVGAAAVGQFETAAKIRKGGGVLAKRYEGKAASARSRVKESELKERINGYRRN